MDDDALRAQTFCGIAGLDYVVDAVVPLFLFDAGQGYEIRCVYGKRDTVFLRLRTQAFSEAVADPDSPAALVFVVVKADPGQLFRGA